MTKEKKRAGFMIYHEDLQRIAKFLDDREFKRVICALGDHSQGIEADMTRYSQLEKIVYAMMCSRIDQDARRYEETCRRNRENALKRWGRDMENA